MTEAEFYELCKAHDLTYTFSDDDRYYRAGEASLKRVMAAAKQLPLDVAQRIWNSVVDEKIVEDSRSIFYWGRKEP